METASYLPILLILIPFLGFVINGLGSIFFSQYLKRGEGAGWLAVVAIFIPFLLALKMLVTLQSSLQSQIVSYSFTWLSIGDLRSDWRLVVDHLSIVMILIITGVGSLIHLYSIEYMRGDKGFVRYFSYLNLFCFMMLILVMSSSLPLMFLGWEGVGLCSYLLIGFWYEDRQKVKDGMKAFIMNRIGDLGFILGLFFIYNIVGSFEFSDINLFITQNTIYPHIITLVALLLFIGATGKSAQIPLFTWLPDAMSGPTPVSALIHAATMVTAGIYMTVRLSPLFLMSPDAMMVIQAVGTVTALLAGTVALAQNDIKRVLAYSTVSQLGFMFMAVGSGAFSVAIFHLTTHAFFKALLFLSAGSVIHALQGEQDMRKMGNLKNYLPHTMVTMVIGALALSGVPFLSGFFSKDEILFETLNVTYGAHWVFIVGLLTSFITALYCGRMIVMTFWGKDRVEEIHKAHLHESPLLMRLPLYLLALLSILGGLLASPLKIWLGEFSLHQESPLLIPLSELSVMGISSLVAMLGLFIAWKRFFWHQSIANTLNLPTFLENLWERNYFIDEFYDFLFTRPLKKLSQLISHVVDPHILDSFIMGVSQLCYLIGRPLRVFQNGDLQRYLLTFIVGVGFMVFAVLKNWI